jgi:small subunit ribosomal protein S6
VKAYEVMLILNTGLDEETAAATMAKAKSVITDGKGTIESEDPWGKRKLSYEIEKQTDGEYFVLQFHAPTETIAELDRVLHITDPVVRYMIVRRDDLK